MHTLPGSQWPVQACTLRTCRSGPEGGMLMVTTKAGRGAAWSSTWVSSSHPISCCSDFGPTAWKEHCKPQTLTDLLALGWLVWI